MKKIMAFALVCTLVLGVTGQKTAYAATGTVSRTIFETAAVREFDTEYSTIWTGEENESWSKIILEENGILEIAFTKVSNDTLGLLDAYALIYNEEGECFYSVRNSDQNVAKAHLFVGLEKGTYYIKLETGYASYAYNMTSTYQFSFIASSKCELETNDQKEYATPMKVGETYIGYLGTGYMVTEEYSDKCDLYEVQLKKGQVYKLNFNKEAGTTIVKLLGKNVTLETLWPSSEADNFCMAPEETFIAPYTGTYYLYIYNYLGEQYKYTAKITNITPKSISISSVKSEKKAFTVKWGKVNCTGYQIQYSTNKNFKNAKSITLGAKKTSVKVSNIGSNKKYYVRIRTYKKVDHKTVYSGWSKTKAVTTK